MKNPNNFFTIHFTNAYSLTRRFLQAKTHPKDPSDILLRSDLSSDQASHHK